MSQRDNHNEASQADAIEITDVVRVPQAIVLERMLSSLERIEELLKKNSNGDNKKDVSSDDNIFDNDTKKHKDLKSQPHSKSTDDVSRVVRSGDNRTDPFVLMYRNEPKKCTVNDIPGYQALPTYLAELPPDPSGMLNLMVSKDWLEKETLQQAIFYFEKFWMFLQKMKGCNRPNHYDCQSSRRIHIIDYTIADASSTTFNDCVLDCADYGGLQSHRVRWQLNQDCIVYYRNIIDKQDINSAALMDSLTADICHTIICEGLSNADGDFDGEKWEYLLFANAHFKDMVKDHLACVAGSGDNFHFDNLFDTNLFQLDDLESPHLSKLDTWKCGELFPGQGRSSGFVYRRKNIKILLYSTGTKRSLLVLAPSGFLNDDLQLESYLAPSHPRNKAVMLSLVVLAATVEILFCWRVLNDKMDDLLKTNEIIDFINPGEYVHQLYDPSNFFKSRFYFWAIGYFIAFDDQISLNIQAVDDFASPKARRWNGKLTDPWFAEGLESYCESLDQVRQRFRKNQKHLESLRDGLYNGSTVMESRQSRVLGENVRLPTFVSIFFLPLGFCANKEKWANRSKAFESFPRSDMPSRPTHWLLFMFAIKICASYIALQTSRLISWMAVKANVLSKKMAKTFTSTDNVALKSANAIHHPDGVTEHEDVNNAVQEASIPGENDMAKILSEPLQEKDQNSSLADLTGVVVAKDGDTANDSLSIAIATPLPASDTISL
ncbi:hypothetical protein NHQ30_001397 [Ciborinia camelliae]|nr:hypothetical protein NHQ30_001397 [Ciborinia camelliae]